MQLCLRILRCIGVSLSDHVGDVLRLKILPPDLSILRGCLGYGGNEARLVIVLGVKSANL